MHTTPVTIQCREGEKQTHPLRACNTQIDRNNALRPPAPPQPQLAPLPPLVAGTLLSGEEISFLKFLKDPAAADYCALLLGRDGTAAAKMLQELRSATEFHYFGYWHSSARNKNPAPGSGKLIASAAAKKALLKKYARRAYRGDTERRGVEYWTRVAWLVWNCYATLMALRQRTETIEQQELKRLNSLPAKRAARGKYMRAYRAKKREEQRGKAAHYTTDEAKEAWRQQRAQTKKGNCHEH